MSRQITFADAVQRFGDLVTTNIAIEDAIQEAIDRIYEMGRWPGTTLELTLEEDDFVLDGDTDTYSVFFDENLYDGAIGFRNANRGWSIVDQTSLYKDGVNSGDMEFVDMGTVTVDGGGYDVIRRKYRCPLGWSASSGPYYALMKLEAPQLTECDNIPIQSLGALKAAIRAVCYEYVADDARAAQEWGSFMQAMSLSTKQTAGPKKYYVGTDSSLRRKPTQFM